MEHFENLLKDLFFISIAEKYIRFQAAHCPMSIYIIKKYHKKLFCVRQLPALTKSHQDLSCKIKRGGCCTFKGSVMNENSLQINEETK